VQRKGSEFLQRPDLTLEVYVEGTGPTPVVLPPMDAAEEATSTTLRAR
jgi:hypothetical protein